MKILKWIFETEGYLPRILEWLFAWSLGLSPFEIIDNDNVFIASIVSFYRFYSLRKKKHLSYLFYLLRDAFFLPFLSFVWPITSFNSNNFIHQFIHRVIYRLPAKISSFRIQWRVLRDLSKTIRHCIYYLTTSKIRIHL